MWILFFYQQNIWILIKAKWQTGNSQVSRRVISSNANPCGWETYTRPWPAGDCPGRSVATGSRRLLVTTRQNHPPWLFPPFIFQVQSLQPMIDDRRTTITSANRNARISGEELTGCSLWCLSEGPEEEEEEQDGGWCGGCAIGAGCPVLLVGEGQHSCTGDDSSIFGSSCAECREDSSTGVGSRGDLRCSSCGEFLWLFCSLCHRDWFLILIVEFPRKSFFCFLKNGLEIRWSLKSFSH